MICAVGFQVCWVELELSGFSSPLQSSDVVYCYRGQTVNARSPVSFEQGYFKILWSLFVILVARADFEPFVGQTILNRLHFLLTLQVMSLMR